MSPKGLRTGLNCPRPPLKSEMTNNGDSCAVSPVAWPGPQVAGRLQIEKVATVAPVWRDWADRLSELVQGPC